MCNTCLAYDVIRAKNAGYEIIDSLVSPQGDLFVTGYDASRNAAVTWAANTMYNAWSFSWGHYYTDPADPYNLQRAKGDMYKRAGFVK